MATKPTYEELERKVKELEKEIGYGSDKIKVSGINIEWDVKHGACTFENLPVAMMWVDTTLAGLMSGVQAMVGTERFGLALQSEGRKSVEEDWQVISQFPDFRDGFKAIANIAAVAGWGEWELTWLDENKKECHFRVKNSWEGRYQKSLNVCWSSGMLSGKMAGYCSKLFETNCWAKQTAFIAKGDDFDEFVVAPSKRSVEREIEDLLVADAATRADMAVALQKLREEVEDRKRVEDALRESERKYSVLVQESPDAIVSLDKVGNLLSFNQAAERISGLFQEEVVGKHFTRVGILAKESIPKALKEFALVIAGTKRPPFELTIMRKDKSHLFMEANPRLIKHQGEKTWVQVTLRDITDRKLMEKEKKEMEGQLQQAQKMEAIGTLAGGIAHDFNNILHSIVGYTELTMGYIPEGSVAQMNLKEVFNGAMRAKDMVQQILAFSRKADTEKKPIKVQSVVMEALKLLKTSIPATIEIRQNIDADCGPILADPTQIHQVIMNLATNAYQAMRETGGLLELTLMEEEIGFDDSDLDLAPGTYLKIVVSDTGHGMDNVIVEKIFDPYFSTKGPGEGTGMGLAVVHGIVKTHDGHIKVNSKLGEGTEFQIYLPLITTRTVKPDTVIKGATPTGTEHILFVDDEEPIVFMTQQILERLGYQVTSRTSSVEALEAFKARSDEFDLVITDMTMPNMTGLELASRLREIRSDIPLIICTGFSEMIDGDKAKSMGIPGYVMKPITIEEIARTIREVLDN